VNLEDTDVVEFMSAFYEGDWQKGLLLWSAKYKKDAMETLLNSDNLAELQGAQAELKMFNTKLPRLIAAYQDFAKQQNAKKPVA
jgi:hypothetical protein